MFGDFYRGKKVLVTGHTGFKGSWICHWLKLLGAEVAGLSHGIVSEPSHFEVSGLESKIRHYTGHVEDQNLVKSVMDEFEPEVVFHLAAEAIVRTCIDDPITALKTNVLGTAVMLKAVEKSSTVKSAVFITSDKCYENVEWEYGYRETDHLGGKDPYSASKAAAEHVFHSFYSTYFKELSSTKIATARAGNVIGGGDWAAKRIVPDCVRSWSAGEIVEIRSPEATRPWQHVLEPLSGYLWLAKILTEKEDVNGESFNFGPRAEVVETVRALVDEMNLHWDKAAWKDASSLNQAKNEAGLLKLCCDKAMAELNWTAILSFKETIQMTSKWYSRFYSKDQSIETQKNIEEYCRLAKERGCVWSN